MPQNRCEYLPVFIFGDPHLVKIGILIVPVRVVSTYLFTDVISQNLLIGRREKITNSSVSRGIEFQNFSVFLFSILL